jgi:hypothetical protein
MEAREAQEELRLLDLRYKTGDISYEELKAKAFPLLDIVNEKAREIAKKFKVKPKLIKFGNFFR